MRSRFTSRQVKSRTLWLSQSCSPRAYSNTDAEGCVTAIADRNAVAGRRVVTRAGSLTAARSFVAGCSAAMTCCDAMSALNKISACSGSIKTLLTSVSSRVENAIWQRLSPCGPTVE